MGALGERKPFLKTLFIFRFFLLAQRAAIFLAQTEGCLAHLVRSRRQQGNEGWREVTVLRAGQEAPARRHRLNGGILFRQTPSSLVITAIRGFQVRLQAHLFLELCVRFVCPCVCVFGECGSSVVILWTIFLIFSTVSDTSWAVNRILYMAF